MSQTDAEQAVLQAIHGDGALTPYGSARVQMQGTTAYIAVPIELTQHFGISQGYEIERAYHADTGCLISCLRDEVDLFKR
jgi:hypothetical protein